MDQDRFDEITIAVADGQTQRTARRRLFGGGLAALLAAVGLGSADDAAAKSCAKKCKKKKSKKARKKCRKKCQATTVPLLQEGSGSLELQSDPSCLDEGGPCVDEVEWVVSGTPIAEGTFSGELSGTNFREGEENTFLADYAGTLTAIEDVTGDTLEVAVSLELTFEQDSPTGPYVFSGTFEIDGGTGRFAGATGSGTVTGSGVRDGIGQTGTIDEFTLEGNIDFA